MIIPIKEIVKTIIENPYYLYYHDLSFINLYSKNANGIGVDNIGNKFLFKDGKVYKAEYINGNKFWYKDGQYHREDGPAVECNGRKEWWVNGNLHRKDGPAIESVNGFNKWYRHGKLLA